MRKENIHLYRHPFNGDLKEMSEKDDDKIHKFEAVGLNLDQLNDFAITEFALNDERDHEGFKELKKFYKKAQEAFGDFLPEAYFVVGYPSDSQDAKSKSFYVIQSLKPEGKEDFVKDAKKIEELNMGEYSEEFINGLLDLRGRIISFLKDTNVPEAWLNEESIDPQSLRVAILRSPGEGKTILANFFKLDPEVAKQIMGSEGKFETRF